MMRYVVSFCIFLIAFVFETSFLASLPSIFPLTPFIFACGVYLIQHHGLLDGFVWIFLYGLFLQLFFLTVSPLPIVIYAIAALVTLYTARHVFSNRSLYGVIACGLAGYVVLVVCDATIRFFQHIGGHSSWQWSEYFVVQGKIVLMLVFALFLLFNIAHPLKSLIRSRTF